MERVQAVPGTAHSCPGRVTGVSLVSVGVQRSMRQLSLCGYQRCEEAEGK